MLTLNIDDDRSVGIQTQETSMLRKISLALAAATVVATAAIPTAASAHWSGWRHSHGHYGYGFTNYKPYAFAPRCYTTKRWVRGYHGRLVVRVVRHCR
jgi:hypothetical protein